MRYAVSVASCLWAKTIYVQSNNLTTLLLGQLICRLCQCAALGRDQLEAIWQYVERFAVQWEELGVSNEVQEFADQFHFQFQ